MNPSAPIRYRPAWSHSFRAVGWLGCVASIIAIAAFGSGQDTPNSPFPFANAARAIEAVLPLVVAVQAAFLFSPDDEPALEVMLACPRPAWWLLLERLVIVWALLLPVGLLFGLLLAPHNPLTSAVRWIPPAVFFAGISTFTTLRGRQPVFSLVVILTVWFLMMFVGQAFLPGYPMPAPLDKIQPHIWLLHAFLPANALSDAHYLVNRLALMLVGIGLLLLTCNGLRHSERLLFNTQKDAS